VIPTDALNSAEVREGAEALPPGGELTMPGRLNRLRVFAVALLLLTMTAGAPSRVPQEEVLPKFHQINEHFYRGAQPLEGGIKRLAALGFKTVVNLRGEDERTRAEEREARASGMRYLAVPLPGFGRPRLEQIEQVLAIINDPANWPVFVHCKHGEDRTGTVAACYRISHDGWTAEQALKEAKRHGMSRFQFGMKDFIKDYYRDQKPALSKKSYSKSTSGATR
jgi:tyrosine-protein phosphatase SIW14